MSTLEPVYSRPRSSAGPKLYDRLMYDLDHDSRVSQEVALGKRVGLYRLRGHLGTGNFAKVKLGLHLLTHEKVAIKIIDKTKLDNQARKLLSQEIICMEALDHLNIIRLYEIIESFSKLHLVMEVAGEGDLQSIIVKEGALAEKEAKSIFAQITAAIQHMHQKGIIHRDLKAENVFFTTRNTVKVGDFGFSTQSNATTLLDTFCGSPPYAAPELFLEESYFGHLVDIWAMGVTLYFMLSATLPFKGDNIPDLRAGIQEGKYNPLNQTSISCQVLIGGLLSVDPKERWNMDNVCSCNWTKTEKRYLESHASRVVALKSSAGTGKLVNKLDSDPMKMQVLTELQQLGVPITNPSMLYGEPRNTVAGAYRILFHSKVEAGKDHAIQLPSHDHDQYNARTTTKQKSKICVIL